ncbi:MAG: hypothetical protein KDB94_10485 [Acidobacteria bacterium]|nr:hypothetical protein [Acidobacteriota bacterium]
MKMCPKIILEGTRLTFKTETAFALNRHPRIVGPRKYEYHSPIVSGEWCAFTNFPWGRGLINFEEAETDMAMETFGVWARLWELQRYYSWIVDRFHWSTIAYQRTQGREFDFAWLEERLKAVGFRVVLLSRSTESFEAARARRLKVSGKPDQYDDLGLFVREQETIRGIAEKSILPWREFDVSDNDIDRVCDEIADWLEETGGLYADY